MEKQIPPGTSVEIEKTPSNMANRMKIVLITAGFILFAFGLMKLIMYVARPEMPWK